MDDAIKRAEKRAERLHIIQSNVDGGLVAQMIMEFWEEFEATYGNDVKHSALCAVGPLQAMIGLAIRNGHLRAKAQP